MTDAMNTNAEEVKIAELEQSVAMYQRIAERANDLYDRIRNRHNEFTNEVSALFTKAIDEQCDGDSDDDTEVTVTIRDINALMEKWGLPLLGVEKMYEISGTVTYNWSISVKARNEEAAREIADTQIDFTGEPSISAYIELEDSNVDFCEFEVDYVEEA